MQITSKVTLGTLSVRRVAHVARYFTRFSISSHPEFSDIARLEHFAFVHNAISVSVSESAGTVLISLHFFMTAITRLERQRKMDCLAVISYVNHSRGMAIPGEKFDPLFRLD